MKHVIVILKISCGVFPILLLCMFGCSTERNTASNRALQNLSARYNLIYNANILLDEYERGIYEQTINDFDSFLPIYHAPPINYGDNVAASKELDEIEDKARTIVADKKLSNYTDEAYILMGKTNFYRGNFFNAFEYFDYVARTYRNSSAVFVNAQSWKARCLLEIEQKERAQLAADTLQDSLASTKRNRDVAFATLAQNSFKKQAYLKTIEYLSKAVSFSKKSYQTDRWNYTLAQLYEHVKDYNNSLKYFIKIEKSNAPFEMYFNAKLSHIRVLDAINNGQTNRQQQLAKLLKDDKNLDFKDQIYYEMGQDSYAKGDVEKAVERYKTSVKESTINPTQKALSYLKIAELNFKDIKDYVNAQRYYDSAATTFPKTSLQYESVQKKALNLKYLTGRYEKISFEDTLRHMATLPKAAHKTALTKYFARLNPAEDTTTATANGSAQFKQTSFAGGTGTFYFSNSMAMARGLTDFKRKWGNRKLEDNWRQSIKTTLLATSETEKSKTDSLDAGDKPKLSQIADANGDMAQKYIDSIPLTASAIQQSDNKIITAYMDIASFYQQELNDIPETIKTYEELLKRYPKNQYLDIIYYSLYLAYKEMDTEKSDRYKKLVLANYPSSVYAKNIADPNFSVNQSKLEAAVQADYNSTFESFLKKDFQSTIQKAVAAIQRFPGNSLESQFAYLKAIGIGRTQPVDPLMASFKEIIANYPKDSLITPLVKEHLKYISEHYNEFKRREVALLDFDPNEPRFIFVDKDKIAKNQAELATYNTKQQLALEKEAANKKLAAEQAARLEAKRKADEAILAAKKQKLAELASKKTADSLANALEIEQKNTIAKLRTDSMAKAIALKKQAETDQKRLDSTINAQKIAKNAKTADSLAHVLEIQKKIIAEKQKADSIANIFERQKATANAQHRLDSIKQLQTAIQQKKTADSLTKAAEAKQLALEKQRTDSLEKVKKAEALWKADSPTLFYMVIAVNRIDINLSSSRFGIGQFNRVGYPNNDLTHNLKELPQDQLIYIGNFSTLAEAKNYGRQMDKQLSMIMKVPPKNYSTFVISKENLQKITDRTTLLSYQDFVKNNEQ